MMRNEPRQIIFWWECGVVEYPFSNLIGERRRKHVRHGSADVHELGVSQVHPDGEHMLQGFDQTVQA